MQFFNNIAARWMRLLVSWVGAASVLFLLGMNPERAAADGHRVRIDELLSGANGDSRIQFVELSIAPESHPLWAPQPGEASSRARLLFYDATGTEVEGFGFSVDPPQGLPDPEHGAHSILVASQAFVDLTGVAADYIFGAPLPAQDGMVCFAWDDSQIAIRHCVAFGNYQGASESDGCTPSSFNGPPAPLCLLRVNPSKACNVIVTTVPTTLSGVATTMPTSGLNRRVPAIAPERSARSGPLR